MDNFSFLPSCGLARGMVIGWNSLLLDGKMIFSGYFYMMVEFRCKRDNLQWLWTSVYGPNTRDPKALFWEDIRRSYSGVNCPWVIYGDFNAIFLANYKMMGPPCLEDIR